jgi:3-hydroxyisobutyrate dehydrogenase-like beta-hydroxyacid dehydrogenase
MMILTTLDIWVFKAAKICNNMAMAISMLGVSEAFSLGQNLGIKATTLTDIFNCSSARCWSRYCLLCSSYCQSKLL